MDRHLLIHIVGDHVDVLDLNKNEPGSVDAEHAILDVMPLNLLFHAIRRRADTARAIGIPTEYAPIGGP